MILTLEQLRRICENAKIETLEKFINPLNQLYAQSVINTKLKFCFYLANVLHETGSFKWLRELSSGTQYEGRLDLGNLQIGDGAKFLGRGALQTTGRLNYQKLSDYLKIDFINQPELLEKPEFAILSSEFYWKNTNLNKWCEKGDFLQVVYRINGGANGLKDRLKYLKRSLRVLQVTDYQKLLDDILQQIKFNITAPKDTHFRKMLAKEVPDLLAYNKLTDFLSKV